MTLAYAFEASSIQEFILDGGKLRDISGGSALIDRLSNYAPKGAQSDDLVEDVLHALRWDSCKFARRGGGAFVLFTDDAEQPRLEDFRRLWTLTVQLHLPGLSFNEAIGHGANEAQAMQRAMAALLRAASQVHPILPLTPPLARRDPRTGGAAVARCHITQELIDCGIRAKRARFRDPDATRRGDTLARKFSQLDVAWPVRLDRDEAPADAKRAGTAFPLRNDNSYVAVVHADGNGLGRVVRGVQRRLAEEEDDNFADRFLAFSQSVAVATERAAAAATSALSMDDAASRGDRPPMPMRPVVLGGDDLSVIVRGDLALEFTATFLSEFERQTKAEFEKLRQRDRALANVLPEGLSAGAGIAFIKSTQPFQLAYTLADSLARFAKTRAKDAVDVGGRPPSCIAFHRVTTAMIDSYDDIRKQELRGPGKFDELTLNPYGVGEDQSFTSITQLRDLVTYLDREEIAHGPLRLLARMATSPLEAEPVYERWRTVMQTADRRGKSQLLKDFDALLQRMGCSTPGAGPWISKGGWRRTPLLDALALLAVQRGDDATATPGEAAA